MAKNIRHIIIYGSSLAALVFVLKWMQWKFLIVDNSIDIYIGLIALFFTVLGIWIALQLTKTKTEKVVIEKKVFVPAEEIQIDEEAIKKLNISPREYEVLQLMAKGLSNADIAGELYLTLSTIKTHVSNLYVKMDVKRRTQAIEKAKSLRIIK